VRVTRKSFTTTINSSPLTWVGEPIMKDLPRQYDYTDIELKGHMNKIKGLEYIFLFDIIVETIRDAMFVAVEMRSGGELICPDLREF
jgi:hypothetical protein